ncbi:MutS protein msh5 [Chamberlinius hualienensis]
MASSLSLSQNNSEASLDEDMRTQDVAVITTVFSRETDNSEKDEQPEIYMSVIWSGGKLGVAFYDSGNCQLYILPTDTTDISPEFLNLGKIIRMARPRIVLAWNKQDDAMLDALKTIVNDLEGESSQDNSSSDGDYCIINLMPTTDFDVCSCRWRLINLKLAQMPEFSDVTSKTIYMSDLFNFSDIAMVRSTGALLKYLDRKRINVELEDKDKTTPIVSVNRIKLTDVVSIDRDTYRALQIFKKEWHPSVYKSAGGGREGFSLFGLFSQCMSSLGNQEMERIFWQPTRNLDVINQRHAAIKFLLHPSNEDLVSIFRNHLKHIKNVTKIMLNMKGSKTGVSEWEKFYNTAYHATQLAQVCCKAKIIFSNRTFSENNYYV